MHLFICMKLHRNYHTDISFNTLKEKGEIKRDIFNCDFQLQKKTTKVSLTVLIYFDFKYITQLMHLLITALFGIQVNKSIISSIDLDMSSTARVFHTIFFNSVFLVRH